MLGLITQLYDIEDTIRRQGPEAAGGPARAERAGAGCLETFRDQQKSACRRASMAKRSAMCSTVGTMRRFTTMAAWRSTITLGANAAAVAIVRKNWFFFGSDRGGETAAIC